MRARGPIAVLVLAALLAGCGGSKPAPVIGTWSGALNQRGLKPFMVTATVHGLSSTAKNSVHYSGIDCRGRWTYLGRSASVYRFREVITGGRSRTCKGTGKVRLTSLESCALRVPRRRDRQPPPAFEKAVAGRPIVFMRMLT